MSNDTVPNVSAGDVEKPSADTPFLDQIRGFTNVARAERSMPFIAVRVTAADFNGKDFDGSPLENTASKNDVALMIPLLQAAGVVYTARGHTDYAWFGIRDEYSNTAWAGPGDYIVYMGPHKLFVVPGKFYDMIFEQLEIVKYEPKD